MWDDKSYKSFEDSKFTLANATLLYHLSETADLALVTDCRNFAMGGVLTNFPNLQIKLTIRLIITNYFPRDFRPGLYLKYKYVK